MLEYTRSSATAEVSKYVSMLVNVS